MRPFSSGLTPRRGVVLRHRAARLAPVQIDWGDGDYGRTARTLMPAAEVLLDAVAPEPGTTLLDVACGTGNVALLAAGRGVEATGVDASEGLVSLARARAAHERRDARFLVGDAGSLPLPDAGFDAAASAFGVIFAPDPPAAAAEMLRVTRPGGSIALTAWLPAGAIFEVGLVFMEALGLADRPAPRWGDADWVRGLLAGAGAGDVAIRTQEIAFTAASPAAWVAEEEAHHPLWRAARRALAPGVWEDVRARVLGRIADRNDDLDAFRVTSGYLVVTASR